MNPLSPVWRTFAILLGLGAMLAGAGCGNPFIAKHRVLVDAIAAPGYVKQPAASYRLVAKRSAIAGVQVQVPVVKACVDAALNGVGMFEAPANAPPDVIIEVSFGQDSTPRVDPATRETYLQLSARGNPGRSLDRATGEELWDVRVAVLGIAGRIETAMPLLAMVAANHLGTDTKLETRLDIPQNSPVVNAVREAAIKTLETTPAPPPATASAAPAAQGSGIAPPARIPLAPSP